MKNSIDHKILKAHSWCLIQKSIRDISDPDDDREDNHEPEEKLHESEEKSEDHRENSST